MELRYEPKPVRSSLDAILKMLLMDHPFVLNGISSLLCQNQPKLTFLCYLCRTAIAKAVSEGHREFTACAVVAHQEKFFTAPCGVCRQTLIEFVEKDIPVYLAKPVPVRVLITSIFKLLPGAFIPKNFTPNPASQDRNLNFK